MKIKTMRFRTDKEVNDYLEKEKIEKKDILSLSHTGIKMILIHEVKDDLQENESKKKARKELLNG